MPVTEAGTTSHRRYATLSPRLGRAAHFAGRDGEPRLTEAHASQVERDFCTGRPRWPHAPTAEKPARCERSISGRKSDHGCGGEEAVLDAPVRSVGSGVRNSRRDD